jgi:hypothetical protein
MYAEDIGLLPPAMFTSCLQDCLENPGNSYDILGRLFQVMNQPGVVLDGRYVGVECINSRLWDKIYPIQLEYGELSLLLACAGQDWSKVRPSIFGNLLEGALTYTDKTQDKSQQQRHAHGIHFTSEADIRSIVFPTIREYWSDRITQANTLKELQLLYHELINYKILDPACGSGNFLYVAYQELKYIETILWEKIANFEDISGYTQGVSPEQFYGMDINAFAVELAKVTLMIGRKIAIDQLGLNESCLPLDTLDKNIICADALFTDWVQADVIIGNPPFLGSKHIRLTLGDEYVNQLFKRFPEIRDVDFCAYWFRLTHDHLGDKGRAGLVATNSISQGKSRAVSLDYITENGGYIYQAISSQEWSGDAKVHVSIVNWSKQKPNHAILDGKEVSLINSSLQSTIKVTQAVRLKANLNQCFQGVIPIGMGFIIDQETVKEWIKQDSKNQEILKLFSMGANLAKNPLGKPERWIIDFNEMSLEEASNYQLPFTHIKQNVKPEREQNRAKRARDYWWQLFATRPAMRKEIANLSYYLTVPRLSKWAIFLPASIEWLAGDQSVVVATEDYYILGVLLSDIHRIWVKAQSSTLKGDTRYTHTTCFETFPFPQTPGKNIIENIRKITIELHEYRSQEMIKKGWGITQLYNKYYHEPASNLYIFHRKLDQLVREAYHFKSEDNILEKLLELNQECAEKESRGELVIGAVAR